MSSSRRGFQAICILFDRVQRVCDILKRGEQGALMSLCGLGVGGLGGAFAMQQSFAFIDRLCEPSRQIPENGREQMT